MALTWLLEPISDDAPCGPDLDKTDDAEFVEYYFEAEGRLPERYFTPGMQSEAGGSPDRVFDPQSVDHKAERATIEGLLKRSKDVRLLSLLARWDILAGRLGGFAEAIQGCADVLETFGDAVNPPLSGGVGDRRGALEELANKVTVISPLQHLGLNGQPDVTYRRYLVASGQSEARTGEDDASVSTILSALQDNGTASQLERTHGDLSRAADGLTRIQRLCKGHPEKSFNLDYSGVLQTIRDLQDLIRQGRPELEPWEAKEAPVQEEETEEDVPPAEAGYAPAVPATSAVANVEAAGAINGQAAARVTLQAVEAYLAHNEPSSAALLLVTQARLLIGRPLIEALETLLPGEAGRAVIDFGPAHGFALPMERLRQLAAEHSNVQQTEDATPPAPPKLATRADVAANIRSVEDYYRKNEPTSPIPLLLVRARTYLDKDFEAIVAELLPSQTQSADGG